MKLKFIASCSVLLVFPIWVVASAAPLGDFGEEIATAMNKMMAGMAIGSSNDVDRDFANMMIPHHQGAIEMAEAELRHGHNEHLRRIAQEIIVDQQQEIAAMRFALEDPIPASIPAPTQGSTRSLASCAAPSSTLAGDTP